MPRHGIALTHARALPLGCTLDADRHRNSADLGLNFSATRGEDADLQAEFRRQAIPVVVANQVSGLQRPVTASMAVTPLRDNEDFTAPYQLADKLFYAPKNAGRNRTRSSMSTQEARTIPRRAAPQSTSKFTANLSANP